MQKAIACSMKPVLLTDSCYDVSRFEFDDKSTSMVWREDAKGWTQRQRAHKQTCQSASQEPGLRDDLVLINWHLRERTGQGTGLAEGKWEKHNVSHLRASHDRPLSRTSQTSQTIPAPARWSPTRLVWSAGRLGAKI